MFLINSCRKIAEFKLNSLKIFKLNIKLFNYSYIINNMWNYILFLADKSILMQIRINLEWAIMTPIRNAVSSRAVKI